MGALATAATDSQASPQAVAAAVQRVIDQRAQRLLTLIALDLREGNEKSDATASGQSRLAAILERIRVSPFETCWNTGSAAERTACGTP